MCVIFILLIFLFNTAISILHLPNKKEIHFTFSKMLATEYIFFLKNYLDVSVPNLFIEIDCSYGLFFFFKRLFGMFPEIWHLCYAYCESKAKPSGTVFCHSYKKRS